MVYTAKLTTADQNIKVKQPGNYRETRGTSEDFHIFECIKVLQGELLYSSNI